VVAGCVCDLVVAFCSIPSSRLARRSVCIVPYTDVLRKGEIKDISS
jgi:hypothetical protein